MRRVVDLEFVKSLKQDFGNFVFLGGANDHWYGTGRCDISGDDCEDLCRVGVPDKVTLSVSAYRLGEILNRDELTKFYRWQIDREHGMAMLCALPSEGGVDIDTFLVKMKRAQTLRTAGFGRNWDGIDGILSNLTWMSVAEFYTSGDLDRMMRFIDAAEKEIGDDL